MLDIAGEAIAVRAVQLEHLRVVARPLIEDRLTRESAREPERRGDAVIEHHRRAAHRPDPVAVGVLEELREQGLTRVVRVPHLGLLDRRQPAQPGVVARVVGRPEAVELVARLRRVRRKVVVDVRMVRRHAERPAVVLAAAHDHPPTDPLRPTRRVRRLRVRRIVAEVDVAAHPVNRKPERVTEPHRVNLRTRQGLVSPEHVPRRNPVRAPATRIMIILDRVLVHQTDPQQLAAQIIRVPRRTPRIKRRIARHAIIDRRITGRLERVGVITRRQKQVALGIKIDLAADMAAQAATHVDPQQLLLAREIQPRLIAGLTAVDVVAELKPRQQAVAVKQRQPLPIKIRREILRRVTLVHTRAEHVRRRIQPRRVIHVHPPVVRELRIDRNTLHTLLIMLIEPLRGRLHIRHDVVRARPRIMQTDLARPRRVQHTPIRKHRQTHRLTRTIIQRHLLETRLIREILRRRCCRQRQQRQASAQSCPSHEGLLL